MKQVKRLLALVLTMIMVFTSSSVSVFAEALEKTSATLTLTVGNGGTVSVSSDSYSGDVSNTTLSQSFTLGENVNFSIKANDGYSVKSISVDGEDVDGVSDGVSSCSFGYAMEDDIDIDVKFSANNSSSATEGSKDKGYVPTPTGEAVNPDSSKDSADTKTDTKDDAKADSKNDAKKGEVSSELSDWSKVSVNLSNETDKLGMTREEYDQKKADEEAGVMPLGFDNGSVQGVSQVRYDIYARYSGGQLQDGNTLACALKYINNDNNNVDGGGKWRNVYCAEYNQSSPGSPTNPNVVSPMAFSGWLSSRVQYCLYVGSMFYYGRSRYSTYRVAGGGWADDYVATQFAIHIVNTSTVDVNYTWSSFISALNAGNGGASGAQKANLRAMVEKFVNDSATYGAAGGMGLDGDHWIDYANCSAWLSNADGVRPISTNSVGGYHHEANYHDVSLYSTNYGVGDQYTNFDVRDQITAYNLSKPSDVDVVWNGSQIYAGFRIRLSDAAYRAYAGKQFTVTYSIAIPRRWGAAYYHCTNNDRVQDVTFLSYSDAAYTYTFSKPITYSVPQQNGTCYVQKSSSNTGISNGNSNYSLGGAKFGIYSDAGCTRLITTLETGNDGKTRTYELAAGTYYCKETSAPKGFILNSQAKAFTVSTGQNTVISIADAPIDVKINLEKSSALPKCTVGNENYSLEGAVYSVYNDAACTQLRTTIKTDKNGNASLSGLPIGKYYVKETTPSKGYSLDTQVYTVDGTMGSTTGTRTITITSKETPILDPVSVLLKKADAETGDNPQGNATLVGAQYTVRFYTKMQDTDPRKDGLVPTRTWVFETKASADGKYGTIRYDEHYKVSGDDLYTTADGAYAIPYGTITIQETKAPNGYALDDTVYVYKMGMDTNAGLSQSKYPTITDKAVSLKITKKQTVTDKAVAGVEFTHEGPDGFVEKLVSDKNGIVNVNGLTHGNHVVYESKTVDGLAINDQKITFTVEDDNTIRITSKNFAESDTNGNISLKVNDEGNLEATVYDKPALYTLHVHKINEKDFALKGAEFTLYSDATCNTVVNTAVTNETGDLQISGLVPENVYYLKETKAPTGYRIPVNADGSDIIWSIRVTSDVVSGEFNFYVDGINHNGSEGTYHISGTTADRVVDMTVVNKTGAKLPNTGSSSMMLIMLIGTALVLGAMCSKRKGKGVRNV